MFHPKLAVFAAQEFQIINPCYKLIKIPLITMEILNDSSGFFIPLSTDYDKNSIGKVSSNKKLILQLKR